MTLQGYLTDVGIKVPTAVTLPQTSLISAVNDARIELASTCDLGLTIENVTLVTGTGSYPFIATTSLTQTGVQRMWVYIGTQRYQIHRRAMGLYPIEGYQGYPDFYYLQNQNVHFYPIPSADIVTDWEILSLPAPLVNITDIESYIPAVYILPTEMLIASYVALIDNKIKLSQEFRMAFINLVSSFTKGSM